MRSRRLIRKPPTRRPTSPSFYIRPVAKVINTRSFPAYASTCCPPFSIRLTARLMTSRRQRVSMSLLIFWSFFFTGGKTKDLTTFENPGQLNKMRPTDGSQLERLMSCYTSVKEINDDQLATCCFFWNFSGSAILFLFVNWMTGRLDD